MIFVCREDNDVYSALSATGSRYARFDSVDYALANSNDGDTLLVLADEYPKAALSLTDAQLRTIDEKGIRAYIEYPRSLPGAHIGEPRNFIYERAVVCSNLLEPGLEELSLLSMNSFWLVSAQVEKSHLVVSKVAGYRKAIFGLAEEKLPLLFELDGHNVLVACSKLSNFKTGRYAPACDWRTLWTRILGWLVQAEDIPSFDWELDAAAAYGRDDILPSDVEKDSFLRCIRWLKKNALCASGTKGDDSVIEGYASLIRHDGTQPYRSLTRADCVCESAMMLAHHWSLTGDPESRLVAVRMLDNIWFNPAFVQEDPGHPAYGNLNWFANGPVFYGDDAARAIMGTLVAASILGERKWDERVLRCILSNWRTTGPLGFRSWRLDVPPPGTDLDRYEFPMLGVRGQDWCYWHQKEEINYTPHYQAYMWALYLKLYEATGMDDLLAKTLNAVRMTMAAYPRWQWMYGTVQEMQRMLVPLSFLVKVADTPESRAMLERATAEILGHLHPCGAIREGLGVISDGYYPPPQSNEEYGTDEAPVIQQDGDPSCDLLYTVNFAFLGLHEVVSATGDDRIRRAEDRMADFVCRVQTRSKKHSYLDGAWMRAFDYDLWEYFGSGADRGWGASAVEAGWSNTWLSSVLAMRIKGESLFDLTSCDHLAGLFRSLYAQMLEIDVYV